MSRGRMRRVDEAIREVVGQAIAGLKDPRVGFVTVTDVKTSPDLSHARVWVSVLESPRARAAGADAPAGSEREGSVEAGGGPAHARAAGLATPASAREQTLAALERAHGHLQRHVADELHLKRTPVLSFHYDETSERALRIGELIEGAASPERGGEGRAR